MIPSPSEIGAEDIVGNLVLWLKLAVEGIGALVIGVGMLLAAWRFIVGFPPAVVTFADVRLTLARFLAIALDEYPRVLAWRRRGARHRCLETDRRDRLCLPWDPPNALLSSE
jgi:hypothetical protein